MALLAALTGLFVLGINRWLITPWSAVRGRRRASVIPRLVIAMLLGVLISTPIVLRVFQPAINTQIGIIKAETGENAERLQAELAALQTVIDSGGKAPLSPAADPQIKSLTKRLDAAQTSERQAYQKWQCEISGQNCAGNSGATGLGQRAQADAEALHNAQAQVAALTNQIQQREKQLTANTQTAEAARYDTALQAVTATQQQVNAARAQHNKTSNRLWIELQALNQLARKNLTITIAGLLFLLLFSMIGCLPLAVKLLERPKRGLKKTAKNRLRRLSVGSLTALVVLLVGRRRLVLRDEWHAHLSGESGRNPVTWTKVGQALGFVAVAIRFRLADAADLAWRPADAVLGSRTLSCLFVWVPVIATAVVIVSHDGLHGLAAGPQLAALVAFLYGVIRTGRWWRGVKPPEPKAKRARE